MSYEVVSAYTLLVGDADGPPTVSVHTTADDAWRALDREIRERCDMRPRPVADGRRRRHRLATPGGRPSPSRATGTSRSTACPCRCR